MASHTRDTRLPLAATRGTAVLLALLDVVAAMNLECRHVVNRVFTRTGSYDAGLHTLHPGGWRHLPRARSHAFQRCAARLCAHACQKHQANIHAHWQGRIKKLMQTDDEVGRIATNVPIIVGALKK